MKSAGKARSNGLYRHIRTSKEIIRNLLNDLQKNCKLTSILCTIALPLVGCAGGWLYYRYVGCTTGTCAVTSSL